MTVECRAEEAAPTVSSAALVFFALATGGFAIGVAEFAAMSLLPYFAPELGVDEPTAGHIISAYALGVVVGAPILAVFGARFSRRRLLVALMGFYAFSNGLSAVAPSYDLMLASRFLSGFPHGAYFGVAALVAASIVPDNRRGAAVSLVMLGLTVATLIGVPLATFVAQNFGWRTGFAIVAALALLTAVLVFLFAPRDPAHPGASPVRELGALARRQVWLTLGIGAIGFGGLFAVYTYLGSAMLDVTHAPPSAFPVVLAFLGLGMTVGNLGCARLADRALMPTAGGTLLFSAASCALYPFALGSVWTLAPAVFLIGLVGGLGPVLQIRLMDVAGQGQTLAAALHHSAFNLANALGPWLGGLAISAGFGWASTGWVGAGLALAGFGVFLLALLDARLSAARAGTELTRR